MRKVQNLDVFYKKVLITAGCIAAVYIALSLMNGEFFLSRNQNYYSASLPEAAGLLSIDCFFLSLLYFLLKKADISKFSFMTEMSRNITYIYFIHWIFIGFIDLVVCYTFEIVFSYPMIFAIAAAVLAVSFLPARHLRRFKDRKTPTPQGTPND